MDNTEGKYFAVIDTETNWNNAVMSIGIVIADSDTLEPVDQKYYIITPECEYGGMYSYCLEMKNIIIDKKDTRDKVLYDTIALLNKYCVDSIFAYNASFDYNHLPELDDYKWFDIMKKAAYKQYNKTISDKAKCWGTGRLKSNYGVEPIICNF